MTDPTGTARLRRSFQAEGNRRLARVRSLTHQILVEHDLMAARNDPLAALLPHPGHRLAAFTDWFERTVNAQLVVTPWWERFLARAYNSGVVAGATLVQSSARTVPAQVPAVYRELAAREFTGIAAAVVQQVARQAAGAAIARRKPLPLYQQVLTVIKKVGQARVKAAVNVITIQLHNAARIAEFRAAGITRVGIDPELLEPARPSRFVKHDHFVLDRKSREEAAAEAAFQQAQALFEKQRQRAEAEAVAREVELEKIRARLDLELTAQLAGKEVTGTLAEAQAELAAAEAAAGAELARITAATAAREAVLKVAWQRVLATRKVERAAAYAAKRVASAVVTGTTRVLVEPKVEEVVTRIVVGAPTSELPKRLTAISSEFVNVQTASDDRVCIICQDLSDQGPYSLEEAQGILPAHVDCRCAWVPAFDMRFKVNRVLAGEEEVAAAEAE